jgi:hypothetical protein
VSEDTERTPLDTIEAFEAAAFRTSQVARRLLAEHPSLSVREIRLHASAYRYPDSRLPQLEVRAGGIDGVRAWAEALGTDVDVKVHDSANNGYAFEYCEAALVVGGVDVRVYATRSLTQEEAAVWRTKQDQATGAGKDTLRGDVHPAEHPDGAEDR